MKKVQDYRDIDRWTSGRGSIKVTKPAKTEKKVKKNAKGK